MGSRVAGLFLALAASVLMARPAIAAVEITLSVSPGEGVVGRPVEVLLRTYAPIGAADLGLPTPSFSYPAPSGIWYVLYPIPAYPFDVTARSPGGEATKVELVRDPSDATLWRGTLTPDVPGEWSVTVSNFPTSDPARFIVRSGEAILPSALKHRDARGRPDRGCDRRCEDPSSSLLGVADRPRLRYEALLGEDGQSSRSAGTLRRTGSKPIQGRPTCE
jgi:hypothetical protein